MNIGLEPLNDIMLCVRRIIYNVYCGYITT
jgi:hypothetical protein